MDGFLTWQRSEEERLECYTSPNVFTLYHHMVVRASIRDSAFHGVRIGRGSLATSTEKLASMTGLSIKQTRNALDSLIASGDITKESHGTFTVYTITDFDRFCGIPDVYSMRANGGQTEGNSEGSRRATEGQRYKKDKKVISKEVDAVVDAWNGLANVPHITSSSYYSKTIASLIDEYGTDGVLEAIDRVRKSEYLTSGRATWFKFGWFAKDGSIDKILAGEYDRDFSQTQGQTQTQQDDAKPHTMTWEESEAFRKKVVGD